MFIRVPPCNTFFSIICLYLFVLSRSGVLLQMEVKGEKIHIAIRTRPLNSREIAATTNSQTQGLAWSVDEKQKTISTLVSPLQSFNFGKYACLC
jgi:hypothetical protein